MLLAFNYVAGRCLILGFAPASNAAKLDPVVALATMLIGAINEFWGNLGLVYKKEAACEAVIDGIVGIAGRLSSAYDAELKRQVDHEDHRGQARYTMSTQSRNVPFCAK